MTTRNKIIQAAKLPQRVFYGRLAEAYDGIGQYVLVALSRGSVSAAYKARVAAGDFGGGRTFPIGTRVPVFSYRGQLEVLLGNIPSVCGCIETFSRGVPSGWGTSEIMCLPWLAAFAQDAHVSAGQGVVIQSSGGNAGLRIQPGVGVWSLPFEVEILMHWDQMPIGSGPSFFVSSDGSGSALPFPGMNLVNKGAGSDMFGECYAFLTDSSTTGAADSGEQDASAGSVICDGYSPFWMNLKLEQVEDGGGLHHFQVEGKVWKDGDTPSGIPLFANSISTTLTQIDTVTNFLIQIPGAGGGSQFYVDTINMKSGLAC